MVILLVCFCLNYLCFPELSTSSRSCQGRGLNLPGFSHGISSVTDFGKSSFFAFHAFSHSFPRASGSTLFILRPAQSTSHKGWTPFHLVVNTFCWCFLGVVLMFFTLHPCTFFPVASFPLHTVVTSPTISSAGVVYPHISTSFETGIIKGFVCSTSCFVWFSREVGGFKCEHSSYFYQNLDRS